MNVEEENELILTCLQGNRVSFEPLVKKYQSHVIALAINILGNRDDALDMAQETFVQVYTNLGRFDTQRNFKTWVLSIAAKRCLDHLRKQKSIFKYFLEHSNESHLDDCLFNEPITIEKSETFYPLLKKMKDKERIALLLKVNENYSSKEIAEVLNCSEVTARVHIFNAIQKLKKELETLHKGGA